MLTEEQRETLEYLRKSPSDALKREAADLIEFLVDKIESNHAYMSFIIKKNNSEDSV